MFFIFIRFYKNKLKNSLIICNFTILEFIYLFTRKEFFTEVNRILKNMKKLNFI